MSLRIEIRDKRIGRLSVTAGTADTAERDRRRASLLQLCETERGRSIIERLRARQVTIEQVHRAVLSLDLASVEAEARANVAPPIGMGATIDAWLEVLHGADRSPQTLDYYRSICRGMESFFGVVRDHGAIIKERGIETITREEGERWLTGRKETTGKPWSPRTQTVAHSLAAQIWDRAILHDEERAERTGTEPTMGRNFWRRDGSRKGLRPGRIRKTRVEFLRRNEAAKLFRVVKNTPYAAWVAVGIYAGLRGGEAANLRVAIDVDLEARRLRIQGREGQHAWRTKTDNSQRDVPIHPRLARWIRRHMARGFAGDLYLFTQSGKDQPLSRSGWRWWTKSAFEAAGIKYGRKRHALVYHSLRHTFASWLTMKDVHPLKISRLMGDTVEMVIRTYSHLVESDLDEAVNRL